MHSPSTAKVVVNRRGAMLYTFDQALVEHRQWRRGSADFGMSKHNRNVKGGMPTVKRALPRRGARKSR